MLIEGDKMKKKVNEANIVEINKKVLVYNHINEKIIDDISTYTDIITFDKYYTNKNVIMTEFLYANKGRKVSTRSKISRNDLKRLSKRIFLIIKIYDDYNYIKFVIKSLIILKKLCEELKINIGVSTKNGICIANIQNESIYFDDIVSAIKSIYMYNEQEQHEFIYDTVCNYLDSKFRENSFCDFKKDKCIASRNRQTFHDKMGCCYSFEYAAFWSTQFIKDVKLCEHMKNKECDTKCISCKMFTCKYLKEKNIQFHTRNILLLDCFFNKKQKLILEQNFFKTREEILQKLREKNNSLYIWYLLKKKYLIKD